MLGDVPPATFNVELQYTPLVFSAVHPHYYLARLQNIGVDGTILPVDQVRAFEPVCVASESCLMMSVAWGLDRLLASMLSTLHAHACKWFFMHAHTTLCLLACSMCFRFKSVSSSVSLVQTFAQARHLHNGLLSVLLGRSLTSCCTEQPLLRLPLDGHKLAKHTSQAPCMPRVHLTQA